MNRGKDSFGFTLIEMMIVVAIIAIVASIALPNLLSSRISANEAAAIGTLRNLHSAQDQLQALGVIDQDTLPPPNLPDGRGEFGYFSELAGATAPRSSNPNPPGVLSPALMPAIFGQMNNVAGEGAAQRAGYYFKMFLPDQNGAPVGELAAGGQAVDVNGANNQEAQWCCYAWPVNTGVSGLRAFFIDESGEVLQTLNDGQAPNRYNGILSPITAANALECFPAATMMAPHVGNAVGSVDGNFWTSVGN